MSYTGRSNYKNRREKFYHIKKKTGLVLLLIIILAFFLGIYFWQSLKDWYTITFN